ncbi:GNAT family N-acetyltransferase [Teredinibacter franksiae]|jgi:Acetyltransferases, including N-acetylases of ribosomal proteins|uniref:GNAT family N-acetyltransferase n=1 Tax=Teredinibacter franksiae TaxID=2761453 RepID=UPI001624B3CC|nr:GNAT family protein [Teredinibacter franksiae]
MIELRELVEDDKDQLIHHLNNENVVRFLSSRIPSPYTEVDAHWWINEGSKAEIVRSITFSGNFVGIIGVRRDALEKSHRGEIGYWIGQPFWGKGIATEALHIMCQIIFCKTDIVQLYAPVFSPNEGSKRVLTKNGFELEGVITKGILKDGAYYDECIYCRSSS